MTVGSQSDLLVEVLGHPRDPFKRIDCLLPRPQTHRALKARAKQHRRSTEAEVRALLDEAVAPLDRVQFGSLVAAIGRDAGGVDLEIERDHQQEREPIDLS